MFFYDKENIDEIEKLLFDIKKYYNFEKKEAFLDINKLYSIVSIYYPYSCIVIINNKKYLCVNDLFYGLDGKINNIFIDDKLNKSNIKHL